MFQSGVIFRICAHDERADGDWRKDTMHGHGGDLYKEAVRTVRKEIVICSFESAGKKERLILHVDPIESSSKVKIKVSLISASLACI